VDVVRVDLAHAPDLSARAREALGATLDADERRRAERLFAADQARFLVAHEALRRLLGERIGCEPEEVRFRRGPFGKPALEGGSAAASLCFNMSHSCALALFAVAGAEVGVDVEDVAPGVDEIEVGRTVFSGRELRSLEAMNPGSARRGAFYALWTRKEALLKGLGAGLSRDPVGLDLGLGREGEGPWTWTEETGELWTVVDLEVGPRRRAALALKGRLIGTKVRNQPLFRRRGRAPGSPRWP